MVVNTAITYEYSISTTGPTNTAAPTNTPAPTATSIERLRAAIEQALSKSNRNVQRVITVAVDEGKAPQIYVRWSINDNFTAGMIKTGAQLDLTNILRACAGTDIPFGTLLAEGRFPLKDAYGHTKEETVVHAVYAGATIDTINWDGFDRSNVYKIADDVALAPAFEQ